MRKSKIFKNNKIIKFLRRKIIKKYNISYYEFYYEYFRNLSKGNIALRAKGISFSFFMAIFPAIIFLFSVIPFIPIDNLDTYILKFMNKAVPDSIDKILTETIAGIVSIKRGGILSVGFITTLYLVSSGILSIILGLESSLENKDKPSIIKLYLNSLKLSFIITAIMTIGLGALAMIVIFIIKFFKVLPHLESFKTITLQLVSTTSLVVVFYMCMASIFYFGHPKSSKWKFFSRGPLLTSILMLLTTYGFEEYVKYFANYNKIYGSIGALIMVMFWIYLNSISIILGFELNILIYKFKDKMNLNK